jgi:3-hydroxyisobutyrate dehydrogenase-like beta-hydroxyacid dehydrogenase
MGHPMFSGSAISQLWQAAAARGYGPEGHTSIYAFLENLSGEEGNGGARFDP